MSMPVSHAPPVMANLNFRHIDTVQKGPVCKLVALRTCMQLLRPDECYPLFKNKMPNTLISVRSVAKKFGSSQGEVTSPWRLDRIAKELGLEADPRRFDNQELMESDIHSAIDGGKPVIVFAQIDPEDIYPSIKEDFSGQWYEHAAVVLGYNKKLKSFTVHDGQKIQIWGASDLYKSSCKVLEKRARETFVKLLKPLPEEAFHHEESRSGESRNSVEPASPDTENLQDTPEPMDWETSTQCKDLTVTINCPHYRTGQPCRYHEISEFLHSGQLDLDNLAALQNDRRVVIRQSDQEPNGNFHKLLIVIDRADRENTVP